MAWTTSDVPDLTGRTAVVTGANSGLGQVIAQELARAGAHVILACRNTGRGERAAREIVSTGVDEKAVEVGQLDLSDLTSVRSFATRCAERGPLDLLINNAGVMALPKRTTVEGFEMQFGTNHLGHFALTGLLFESLLASPAPRVVTLTSVVGFRGKIDFADLNGERYRKWKAYSQSKLANLLFARELSARAQAADLPLLSVAAHPGYASTNLQTTGPQMAGSKLMTTVNKANNAIFAQSAADGALPALYAATADVSGGDMIGPAGFLQLRGAPEVREPKPRPKDLNPEVARTLWEESERLTGVRYEQLAAS